MNQIIVTVIVVLVVILCALILWRHGSKKATYRTMEASRAEEIGEKLRILLPSQFIVADIETTGLYPERHEIIEIAAIKVNSRSNNHATLSGLIIPKEMVTKKITDITGISNEMLERDGETLDIVMHQFLDFVGDLRLVFYNAPFDMSFLVKAARQINRELPNPVSDALDMARRAFPGMPSYKLSELAKAGGIDAAGAHRALKDCRMTLIVYTSCVARLGRLQ